MEQIEGVEQMQELKKHFITAEGEYVEGNVTVFRQTFTPKAQIREAVLYATALGVYEAEINENKVGEQMFAPGYSYYPRRVLYQKHDVTNMLEQTENELIFYLGQGWYCGRFLCENQTQIYGERSAVSWILQIAYADGTTEEICSNPEVEILESPYEYAGEYDGEIYHANRCSGADVQVIGHAMEDKQEKPFVLEPTTMEVRLQDEMKVQSVSSCGDKVILDFGQNFAGVVEIDPSVIPEGATITIRHGEILNADGTLYTANLRKAKATIVYHVGNDKRIYHPRFTYMGFRYMELSGVEYQEGMIRARAIHSQMTRTGNFQSTNVLVQQLYNNQVWGQKSNYVEVPTDCPQRDERMGYAGDGQVFALTGAYNYNTDGFWKNFLRDLELGQMDNTEGYVCATVPQTGANGIGFLSMLGWGNAVTIIPNMLYWQFGDEEALLAQYDSMKLFVDAEIRKMGRKNLWIGPSLGDWLAMGKGMAWQAMHNNPVSNSFIVNDLKIITQVARKLNKTEDAAKYQAQYEATRDAYIKKFVNKNGVVAKDYQSAYIMALQYVIPEGELRGKVLSKFVKNVRREGMTTGFFATEFILPLLIEAGEQELAYDVLLHEGCPGWMYQVKCGATTTWERWDALRPDGTVNEEKNMGSDENMVSFNHYAFGSVGEFYYQYILGIKPLAPGYQKIKIQPYPDLRLGEVSGSYQSCAGEIKVAWKFCGEPLSSDAKKNDDNAVPASASSEWKLEVTTPSETEIHLPDGSVQQVLAGSYEFNCQL